MTTLTPAQPLPARTPFVRLVLSALVSGMLAALVITAPLVEGRASRLFFG